MAGGTNTSDSGAAAWTPAATACSVAYAAITCFAPLVAAMSLGFTSPALETMEGEVPFAGSVRHPPPQLVVFGDCRECLSWFSSLVNCGALAGALLGAPLCKQVGQRNVLRIAALLMGGAWSWMSTVSSPWQLCTLRVPIGVGVGLQSVAAPSLIASVSPPHLRGALGTANAAAILLGVMAVGSLGGSVARAGPQGEFCQWRHLSIWVACSAVLVLAATMVLPKPAPPAAELSPVNVSIVSNGIAPVLELAEATSSSWVQRRHHRRLAVAGLVPMLWQQLSGINTIVFFGQGLLASAGVQNYNLLGVLVMGAQLSGIAVAACLIERVGRRPLLLLSVTGMAIASACLAVLLQMHHPPGVLIVGALGGYAFLFSVGLGPVPWLLLPELGLPRDLGLKLASFATACNWACSFAVTGPPLAYLEAHFGLSGAFAVFSSISFIGAILIAGLVPETRGFAEVIANSSAHNTPIPRSPNTRSPRTSLQQALCMAATDEGFPSSRSKPVPPGSLR